jgi:acyl-homoserine lactone acylase PvdQ
MSRRASLRAALYTASVSFAAIAVAVPLVLIVPPAAPAAAAVLASNDYCLEQCADILPPGQNGNATLAGILLHQTIGTRPAHSADQLDKYANLVYNYAGLADEQIGSYFNNASFGVPAGQVERSYAPRSDVTIVRDTATGTPHVTGTTRAGTMFGAGYAGAEDRLFTMDLLRHVGRGTLTSFAGGSPGNRDFEQSVWRHAPYTEADLQAQVNALQTQGTRGAQLYADVQSYVAGVNAYIGVCMANRNCPGEYVLTGHLDAITNAGGPVPFTMTDLIATATLVGGLFGGGGGGEMQSALVRIAARARYGATQGDQVWKAFREQNDPEAVLTLHNGQSFPYGGAPDNAASVVLPDAGTAVAEPVVTNPTGSATTRGLNSTSDIAAALGSLSIGTSTRGMSNAVVVSAAHSATGHPIAVFGPQTGYFSPQLLMVQELQGPGISARGAAFAGLNLYVLLGRGQDYAWSATSSAHDLTDTFAVALCAPNGGAPTLASTSYVYHGSCLPMEELAHTNTWTPTTADSTPAGSYRLVTYRTRYGLVRWRATVGGAPYAFTELRSTYRHEADSAIGFQMFNDPAAMGSASAFLTAAAQVGYAFNWFYVNSSENAYFDAGLNPVRAAGADPNLPMSTSYEWAGFDPAANTATYAPAASHPQAVNQDYFVSWNNKQAKDFSAADGNFSFGSVQRADLLDAPVKAAVAAGTKLSRADVVAIMGSAAVTDLRGVRVLDELLRVISSAAVTDPNLAGVVSQLTAWRQAGAPRVETSPGSKTYQYAAAIRIFDAWWPLLVSGQFKAGLGDGLYQALVNTLQINESPSGRQSGDVSTLPISASESVIHKGSSFQYGWWGYVDKDLRAVLGDPVQGGLSRTWCGDGVLATCRAMLLSTLGTAAGQPAATVYPGDANCAAGDQWCADAILQSPLGGITDPLIAWQNRPTYQQVVSFPAHRGDVIANAAAGRPVSASSSQLFYPAGKAVDGDPGSRWASDWSDNQSITVDLGAATTVGRAILRWETAYARAYRIDVSTNGSAWTTVFTTANGNGGTDNDAFAAVTARYVRMSGVTRATSYGYSLYEFEVYRG